MLHAVISEYATCYESHSKLLQASIAGECCRRVLQASVAGECCRRVLQESVAGEYCRRVLQASIAGECCRRVLQASVAGECCRRVLQVVVLELGSRRREWKGYGKKFKRNRLICFTISFYRTMVYSKRNIFKTTNAIIITRIIIYTFFIL